MAAEARTRPQAALILASASPRRRELLQRLGLPFEIRASGVSEDFDPGMPAEDVALSLARDKAWAVARQLDEGVVIGSDTTVVIEGTILGKPADAEDARRMLRLLRGRHHEVITAVAVVEARSRRLGAGSVTSRVTMTDFGEDDLDRYAASGEPFDKAGGYAIQGLGGRFVTAVEGCYNNVVGLPLCEVARLLRDFGIEPPGPGPVCTGPSEHQCCPRCR